VKSRDWARAAEPLRETLPEFRLMRFGLVQEGAWLAKGIYADSSAFRGDRFFIHAFVLPLFVPTDHLQLTYGFRVGSQWEAVDASLLRAVVEALPHLDSLATLPALSDMAHDWRVNIRHAELRLCIALIEGDEPTFNEMATVVRKWRPQHEWEADVIDRSLSFVATFEDQGRDGAEQVLAARRQAVLEILQ